MVKNKTPDTSKKAVVRPRNPVARSPLLRKGGVHEKTKTTIRRVSKQQVQDKLESWRDDVAFEESIKKRKG